MKLRIKGNALRLRITQSELDTFAQKGKLEECIEFGENTLRYRLLADTNRVTLSADFASCCITVYVPESIKEEWVTTDRTGFSSRIATSKGKELFLLIEKDFVCLDNTLEDQSDNFPNPKAVC
ncbi:MAG: DUF7009 family protein [Bacteroidia bacterium]